MSEKTVTVRIDRETHKELKEISEKERRTFAYIIKESLKDWIKKIK